MALISSPYVTSGSDSILGTGLRSVSERWTKSCSTAQRASWRIWPALPLGVLVVGEMEDPVQEEVLTLAGVCQSWILAHVFSHIAKDRVPIVALYRNRIANAIITLLDLFWLHLCVYTCILVYVCVCLCT